jgi:hypothetical protein
MGAAAEEPAPVKLVIPAACEVEPTTAKRMIAKNFCIST